MEINKHLKKSSGSSDGQLVADFISAYSSADWAQEGGDACLPTPWSWIQCSTDPQPKITSIKLSRKNLTGSIPLEFTALSGLVELQVFAKAFSKCSKVVGDCRKKKLVGFCYGIMLYCFAINEI